MRYLQSFALFESTQDEQLDDLVWATLQGMVSFPQLLQTREEAWAAVIGLWDWEEYTDHFSDRDDLPPMSEEEYVKYQQEYEGVSPAQVSFDDFIAGTMGYTEYPHEIRDDEAPLEWYMEYYEQPRSIASMMKAVADQDPSQLDLDPAWQ